MTATKGRESREPPSQGNKEKNKKEADKQFEKRVGTHRSVSSLCASTTSTGNCTLTATFSSSLAGPQNRGGRRAPQFDPKLTQNQKEKKRFLKNKTRQNECEGSRYYGILM